MTDVAPPERIDAEALRGLLERRGPVATIAGPMTRAATTPEENALRLKNALKAAGDQLVALGLERGEAERLLAPAAGLLRDSEWWMHQLDGLVLHVGPEGMDRWRVPYAVPERVVVQRAPLVTPLLPALDEDQAFMVLAIGRRHVRLLSAGPSGVERLDLAAEGAPTSVEDLPGDIEPPELQHRAGGRGGDPSIFHGHEDSDFDRRLIDRLFRAVDAVVARLVPAGTPVVLAGVEENVAHYRRVTSVADVVDGALHGAPEGRGDEELRAAAHDLLRPRLRAPVAEALEAVAARLGTGTAVADLPEVVAAAVTGRVATLLAARDAVAWGQVDVYGRVELNERPEPGDEDLVDAAVRATLRHGGAAHAVDPAEAPGPVAALLRY